MKIEQLERFLVVADCLNFTTAAERLYVGQSTISRQISALEEELGVTLLIRGPRSVQLTEAGIVMQREATKLLEHVSQLQKRVREAGRGAAGTLRITTIPAYIPALTVLQRMTSELYPKLRLIFQRISFDQIPQQLDAGAADFGITFSFFNQREPRFEQLSLCQESFCILCSRNHWAAAYEQEGLYLRQLQDEEFYFGRDALQHCRNLDAFDPTTIPKPTLSSPPVPFTTMEDMLMRIDITNGIAVFPDVAAHTLKDNLACVPLLDKNLRHDLILLWRKDNPSPNIKHFLDVVHTYQTNPPTEKT